jgi:hypothetical protein
MFEKYLKAVQSAQIKNIHWRSGQLYFNVLYDIDKELADSIRGGELDPFHRDDKIPEFLAHVERAWS